MRRLTLGVLTALLASGIALSIGSPASASGVAILGVTDEYPAPAVQQWAVQVDSLYGDTVNIATATSLFALNEYAQGLINFGITDFPYGHPSVSNYYPSGTQAPFQYVPLVGAADCFAYNLTSTRGSHVTTLRLDSAALAGIFTGTITKWDDPTLAALNPHVALPDADVVPVVRSDVAMESYVLSLNLRDNAPAAWDAYTAAIGFPNSPQVLYPAGTAGAYQAKWLPESGPAAAIQYVADSAGTITYVPPAYALEHNLPCAPVENASGFFNPPTGTHVSAALRSTDLRADTSANPQSIIESHRPEAYPLSWYVMAVTQTSSAPAAVGATLGAFLKYAVCQGQTSVGALGYAVLPPRLVKDAFEAIRRINGAADPGPVTATNCLNPYLTGAP